MGQNPIRRSIALQTTSIGILIFTAYCCILAAFAGFVWRSRKLFQEELISVPRIHLYLIGFTFLFIGMVFLVKAAQCVAWLWLSRHWLMGEAIIVSNKMSERFIDDSDYARISFEFTADDKRHVSDNFRFGDVCEHEMKDLFSRYYLGRRVNVYFDPKNPERCCVERQVSAGLLMTHVLGFSSSIAGILICILISPFNQG